VKCIAAASVQLTAHAEYLYALAFNEKGGGGDCRKRYMPDSRKRQKKKKRKVLNENIVTTFLSSYTWYVSAYYPTTIRFQTKKGYFNFRI